MPVLPTFWKASEPIWEFSRANLNLLDDFFLMFREEYSENLYYLTNLMPGGCQSFYNSEAMAVKLKFEIWFVKLSLTKNVRASSSPCNSGFKNDNKDV